DWSSDVCSSDLVAGVAAATGPPVAAPAPATSPAPASGRVKPATSTVTTPEPSTTSNAWCVPQRSPSQPSSGGPPRKAVYPIEDTTLTRTAEYAGSSAAALMPTGNPSAAPAPQTAAPITATGSQPPSTTSSTPASTSAPLAHSERTRP